MIKLSTIKFSELIKYNDSNSIVMMGIYPLDESETPEVCEFFESESGLRNDSKVVEIKRIVSDENPIITGGDNRVDWLVVFDKEEVPNPIKRLRCGSWVKWTSDFIENYKEDYTNN